MSIGKEMFDAHCALKKADNDKFKAKLTALLEELKAKKETLYKEKEEAHEVFMTRIKAEVDAMDERERQEYLECMKNQAVGRMIEELIDKLGLGDTDMKVRVIRLGDLDDYNEHTH